MVSPLIRNTIFLVLGMQPTDIAVVAFHNSSLKRIEEGIFPA
jgi:hypothetical protein